MGGVMETLNLTIRNFSDPLTGCTIRAVGKSGTNTAHHYFTAMTWMSDSRNIIVSAEMDKEMVGQYVRLDTETGESEAIVANLEWGRGLVSFDDQFYYFNGAEIIAVDLRNGQTRIVCTQARGVEFYGPQSITNDDSVLGVYWRHHDEWTIGTVDIATGRVTAAVTPRFAEPYRVANHAMVNPVHKHLVFFAHEGKTEHISDRIHVVDTQTGEARHIVRQERQESGELGEYIGHEMWAFNGESLFYVKYAHSPLKPTGVYKVDKQGERSEFINGDYEYWHVSLSPDGQWAVADTLEGSAVTKIVLINLDNNTSRLLCEVPMWHHHPGHPHPSFSPDSRKVSFTFADEDYYLWVGIIEI